MKLQQKALRIIECLTEEGDTDDPLIRKIFRIAHTAEGTCDCTGWRKELDNTYRTMRRNKVL